ncbi:hypothetical protein YTPLAS72_30200 [Nitrospira sp.]|nr:hypothetical protein YTPLAS72_30200 [Nitrospira sp.]
MHTRPPISALLILIALHVGLLGMTYAEEIERLDTVRGTGCYRFGNDEVLAKARLVAMAFAKESAVRSHRAFIESTTRVKHYQIEDDLVQTVSATLLQEITIETELHKIREICVTLRGKIDPVFVYKMLTQRLSAIEISREAQKVAVPTSPMSGLKVWTNKKDGRFIENDKLIIYVQSDRDAYLKLDYFQADGTVVHLVPNVYREQNFIKGGKTYSFGDDTSQQWFEIKAPYGTETIKAIIGSTPFEITADDDTTRNDSRTYLNNLRGIKVIGAAASVEIKTDSLAMGNYRQTTKYTQ